MRGLTWQVGVWLLCLTLACSDGGDGGGAARPPARAQPGSPEAGGGGGAPGGDGGPGRPDAGPRDGGPVGTDGGAGGSDGGVDPQDGGSAPTGHTSRSLYVGVAPEGIAVGDFDGDGAADVALGLVGRGFSSQYVTHPGQVQVLRNDGRGGLSRAFERQALLPTRVVAGDVDGDGRLDLLTSVEHGLELLAGGAPGALLTPRASGATGGVPVALGIEDVVGDDRPDLWINAQEVDESGGGLFLFEQLPDGSFGRVEVRDAERQPVGREARAADTADFDGDGASDFVLLTRTQVQVLLRTAPDEVRRGAAVTLEASSLLARDFSGDGRADVLAATRGALVLLHGDGRGGLAGRSELVLPLPPGRLLAADLGGDALPDVVVLHPAQHAVTLLYGRPEGGLAVGQQLQVGERPADAALADLDHDGRLELLVTHPDANTVSIHTLPPPGHVEPASTVPACVLTLRDGAACAPGLGVLASAQLGASHREVAVADLDGDGRLDLALPQPGAGVRLALNQGGGAFRTAESAASVAVLSLAPGDFDGDGRVDLGAAYRRLDVAIPGEGAGAGILWNEGGAQLRPMTDFLGTTPPAFDVEEVAAADLDGDGRLDLVYTLLGVHAPASARLLQRPDGTFREEPLPDHCQEPDDTGAPVRDALLVDFDRDGLPDIAAATLGLNLDYSAPDGTLRPGQCFALPGQGPLRAGDVDGDGRVDVVTSGDGRLHLLRGDAGGTLRAPSTCDVGADAELSPLDVDGDGRLDLVGLERAAPAIVVRRAAGGGTVGAARRLAREARPVWVGTADFLGAGRPQLAVLLEGGRLLLLETGCP